MPYPHLKYAPVVQSFLDSSFFQELSRLKLEVLKLDEQSIKVYSRLDLEGIPRGSSSVSLFLNKHSFDRNAVNESDFGVCVEGAIYNYNNFEQFKSLDKQKFLQEQGFKVWEDQCLNINNCVRFIIISFADLKKYKYYYWVLTPCFILKDLKILIKDTARSNGDLNLPRSWFHQDKNKNKWVSLIDQNDNVIDYSKGLINMNDFKAICIRDCSNLDNIPSMHCKNIFSIIHSDYPSLQEIDVYFIREEETKCFVQRLFFEDCTNHKQDKTICEKDLKFSGWERNIRGKLMPRIIDLSSLIDPLKISEQSVDLNLKLMKWRIVPDINLDIVKNTKILILGSGTLGCYVSRTLMAWGVRKITLVDNGTVSFSNPVRQPLFEFDDCGKPKADTAATALKKIFPMVNSTGIQLSVPMIGHPITNEQEEEKNYKSLVSLIEQHDVIYLLMDSRETRWLPTVIANSMRKLVINAALGFDSYLVMRHGIYSTNINERRLGCYFCNDVVVPTDSLSDKTLDQMCTVTRPGVALMAASQAVELMVSLLQHPEGGRAIPKGDGSDTMLGGIPHQIRGFLSKFNTLQLEAPAYENCSGCGHKIIEAYKELKWEFVKRALNDNDYIEMLSGLYDIKKGMEIIMDDIEWDVDEEEEYMSST